MLSEYHKTGNIKDFWVQEDGESRGGQPAPGGCSAGTPGTAAPRLGIPSLVRRRIIETALSGFEITKCPNPVGFFWAHVNEKTIAIPAPCKRWDCPICAKQKVNMLRDGIRDGSLRVQESHEIALDKRFFRFLTLTQHSDDPVAIMKAWHRFVNFLKKRGYTDVHYFGVKEFTKKGKRHLHVLINQFIPSALIKTAWLLATEGHSYIIDIRRVDGRINRPAGYITKYMTKWGNSTFRKHERRYFHDRKNDWSPYRKWKPPVEIKWNFLYEPQFPMMAKLDSPAGGKIAMAEEPPP